MTPLDWVTLLFEYWPLALMAVIAIGAAYLVTIIFMPTSGDDGEDRE